MKIKKGQVFFDTITAGRYILFSKLLVMIFGYNSTVYSIMVVQSCLSYIGITVANRETIHLTKFSRSHFIKTVHSHLARVGCRHVVLLHC